MDEVRKLRRVQVVSYVKVRETGTEQPMGRIVDITTEGMRLAGNDWVEPNSVIHLKMAFPNKKMSSPEVRFDALVIWCRQQDGSNLYDYGVQLIDVPSEDLEAIEQFIEDSSSEERWLSISECFGENS